MLRFRWITFDRFKVVNLSRFYRVNFIRPYWVNFTVFSNYWHAFEESAYQLSQLFVTHDVTVLRHKVYPFPVLMVSISDDELQAYGKNHIFRKKVSGYRELVGIGISMKRYKEWHKKR